MADFAVWGFLGELLLIGGSEADLPSHASDVFVCEGSANLADQDSAVLMASPTGDGHEGEAAHDAKTAEGMPAVVKPKLRQPGSPAGQDQAFPKSPSPLVLVAALRGGEQPDRARGTALLHGLEMINQARIEICHLRLAVAGFAIAANWHTDRPSGHALALPFHHAGTDHRRGDVVEASFAERSFACVEMDFFSGEGAGSLGMSHLLEAGAVFLEAVTEFWAAAQYRQFVGIPKGLQLTQLGVRLGQSAGLGKPNAPRIPDVGRRVRKIEPGVVVAGADSAAANWLLAPAECPLIDSGAMRASEVN
jgi:hypothetical protein